jgi:glycosyltransferase involved in cell wall biosynthesis
VSAAARRDRRVLVLEPYYAGSHRAVLDGVLARLADGWNADVLTLPARKWKWRMRGAAINMADRAREMHAAGVRWDLVFASTFVNLAEFKGLAGEAVAGVPSVVYFHENQLLYPVRHEAEWDLQFPLTNITSALAADRCWFNTAWNLDGFLSEMPGFLKRFPDHQPKRVVERIRAKSSVLHPPFDPAAFDALPPARAAHPRIVWPHRWEHDKDPDTFFEAVAALAAEGLDFEVAVAGQAFADRSDCFAEAQATLGQRLVHIGEPGSREDYARLLRSSDIAVSTAVNEFFGIAMLEACYAGCFPLVPDDLAYPELYRPEFRYRGAQELQARLRSLVAERPAPGAARDLGEAHTFDALMPAWREAFDRVSGGVVANGTAVRAISAVRAKGAAHDR